jgi:hypothetical protein
MIAALSGIVFGLTATMGARVDVTVEFDKTFDFTRVKTWAWSQPPGDLKMARTRDDDPEAMRKTAEPVVLDAVAAEMPRRGMNAATTSPDLTLTYYLLLTTNLSAQTMGQFLPPTAEWGLPPFAPATQSLKMMNHGSLVLDFSSSDVVVWRGLARAQIKIGVEQKQREALIREAVRDLLRRFPPKS